MLEIERKDIDYKEEKDDSKVDRELSALSNSIDSKPENYIKIGKWNSPKDIIGYELKKDVRNFWFDVKVENKLDAIESYLIWVNKSLNDVSGFYVEFWKFLVLDVWYWKNYERFIFDLWTWSNFDIYVWNNPDIIENYKFELKQEKEKRLSEIVKNTEGFDKILWAIEFIFDNNFTYWAWSLKAPNSPKPKHYKMLKWTEKLTTDMFWEDLKWKTIQELQIMARNKWHNLIQQRKRTDIVWTEEETNILKLEEKYMTFLVGLTDKLEWWASVFKKTENEMVFLISDIVYSKKTTKELFDYYKSVHLMINENWRQSTTVERQYKDFIEKLNVKIAEKLFEENASDETILEFVKLVTWRWIRNDWNVEDTESANLILLQILWRENGILSRLTTNDKLKIEDKESTKKWPKKVIDDFVWAINRIYIVWENGKSNKLNWEAILAQLNFDDLALLWDKKYEDLEIKDQIKITSLAKITKALKPKVRRYTRYRWKVTSNESKTRYTRDEFWQLIQNGIEDWKKEVNKMISKVFDWKWIRQSLFWMNKRSLKKMKNLDWSQMFSDIEMDIIDLYVDINWNWFLNGSDSTNTTLASIGLTLIPTVVWGIIIASAVAAAAPVVGWSVLLYWAVAWVWASVTSWTVNWKWYDSYEEMYVDLWTDVLVWWATGALSWPFANKFWWLWQKMITKSWLKVSEEVGKKIINKWIVGWDLVFLWLWPEVLRNMWLDKLYHGSWSYDQDPALDMKIFGPENLV